MFVRFFNKLKLELGVKDKDPYRVASACRLINKICDDNNYTRLPDNCRSDSKVPFIDLTGVKYED